MPVVRIDRTFGGQGIFNGAPDRTGVPTPAVFVLPVVDNEVRLFDQKFCLPANYPSTPSVTVEVHGRDVYLRREDAPERTPQTFCLISGQEGWKDVYGVITPEEEDDVVVIYLLNLIERPVRVESCRVTQVERAITRYREWYVQHPQGLQRYAQELDTVTPVR